MKGEYGLVANVVSDRVLRVGAKVWILGWNGDAENAQVRGLSRGGRMVTKYIRLKRLKNFRSSWIPVCRRDDVWPTFQFEKEYATKLALLMGKWETVQIFHPNGTLIRAGVPTSVVFQ